MPAPYLSRVDCIRSCTAVSILCLPPGRVGLRFARPTTSPAALSGTSFNRPSGSLKFIWVDAEDAGKAPDRDGGKHDQAQPFAAETSAGQNGAQLVLTAPQELLEVGRCRSRSPSRSPGSAALIARRHQLSPRYAR